MAYAAAVLAASCFMIALRALAIPSITARVVSTGREAARVMGDKAIGDDDKERLLQRASLALLASFASITARTGAAVAAAALPLLGLHAAGLVALESIGHALVTWQGILLTTLAMTAVYFMKVRS